MNAKELLNALIDRVNRNPMNSRKIYFTFTEIVDIDKKVSFEINFGCSENNSLVFKEYLSEKEDKEICKERLYSNVISQIFENIYKRIDSDTFTDNGWSKIIRIDN